LSSGLEDLAMPGIYCQRPIRGDDVIRDAEILPVLGLKKPFKPDTALMSEREQKS
jgi:hypothetical protein